MSRARRALTRGSGLKPKQGVLSRLACGFSFLTSLSRKVIQESRGRISYVSQAHVLSSAGETTGMSTAGLRPGPTLVKKQGAVQEVWGQARGSAESCSLPSEEQSGLRDRQRKHCRARLRPLWSSSPPWSSASRPLRGPERGTPQPLMRDGATDRQLDPCPSPSTTTPSDFAIRPDQGGRRRNCQLVPTPPFGSPAEPRSPLTL
jgi:hypothetical protein